MTQFKRALVVVQWGNQGLSLGDLLYTEAQGYPRVPGGRTACFTVDQAQIRHVRKVWPPLISLLKVTGISALGVPGLLCARENQAASGDK